MRVVNFVIVAAALAIAPAAAAQNPSQVIAFLDKTGDGKVDLNEYLTFQLPKLAQFDESKDGELNLSEFRNSLEGPGKKNAQVSFNAFNAEGGRTMTQREFLGYHAYVFKTYVDTDKDGFMSAEEWTTLMAGRN